VITDRLKAATRERHHRVETLIDVMRADLRAKQYFELLSRLYGFVRPWEDALASRPTDALTIEIAARRKARWLEEDLAYANVCVADVPRCDDLPPAEHKADALGAMYVIEGSTLGGRFIAPHVRRVLQLDEAHGTAYFDGYGARTSQMWNSFRGLLCKHSSPADDDRIVRGACSTFDKLEAWLSRCEVTT